VSVEISATARVVINEPGAETSIWWVRVRRTGGICVKQEWDSNVDDQALVTGAVR